MEGGAQRGEGKGDGKTTAWGAVVAVMRIWGWGRGAAGEAEWGGRGGGEGWEGDWPDM